MRDVKHLANDLKVWITTSKQEAKRRIADQALAISKENSPKWDEFLMDQGYAYIDGELYKKSGSQTAGHRRVTFQPIGGYSDDVAIVYSAHRISLGTGQTFDYSYYLGRVNPGWLRFAETAAWIETGLNPEVAIPIIKQVLRERWT
jgi:hypothetical protein